ncbi:MAG TPA: DMT family transporter [Actinomycetota bacterium]|nr:DMT family transporter [Actinomycetota bacterium]
MSVVRPYQVVLLVVGVVAVSFAAIFIRIADAPALSTAFYRNAMAAALFLPLVVAQRNEVRRLSSRQLAIAFLSGALLAMHFATWIASLSFTTVAASVVLVTTSPIFVAAASRVLFGERVGNTTFIGILIGLAGAAIVSGGDFGISKRAAAGDLLALAGAITAAGYLLAGRRLRSEMSLFAYVGVVYTTCAVLLLPAAALGGRLTGFSGNTWFMFVLLAVIPQALGHTVFNYLLKDMDASLVAISIMGEPVGSTLLALAFFGEVPPLTAIVGGVLILIGIYVAVTKQPKSSIPPGPDLPASSDATNT